MEQRLARAKATDVWLANENAEANCALSTLLDGLKLRSFGRPHRMPSG